MNKKDLYETYLPAFEALVKEAKVDGVMASYNAVNGTPSCANSFLLTDLLRKKWGFDGYVVSDCGAVAGIASAHHYAKTPEEAAADALIVGVNLNCGNTFNTLSKALKQGLISEKLIDERVRQLFKIRFRLGLFDLDMSHNPYARIGPENIHSEAHIRLARKAALESIVLLKNKNNVLPLSKNIKVPYVTGPFANSCDMLMGNYYGISPRMVTILEGVANAVSLGTSLNYRSGALPFHKNINPRNWAPHVAAESDVTICVLGLTADREGEAVDAIASDDIGDRKNLQLPQNQIDYIKQLAQFKKGPLILVIARGSPVSLEGFEQDCDAILQIWYPGEQGGNAVADVLFGNVSPSGHLPITFPKSVRQLPSFEDYSMKGRTYKFMRKEPLFPFGFGLSYTTFEFRDMKLSQTTLRSNDELTVSCQIINSGKRGADDVIQLYLIPPDVGENTAQYILTRFSRVSLKAGEKQVVKFKLAADDFKLVNQDGRKMWFKAEFKLAVGDALPSQRSLNLGASKPVEASVHLE